MNAWDARLAARTFALIALAFLAALLLTAATDEGGVAWIERIARTLPALPLAGAAGAWLATAPLRTRGDLRALASIGRNPWQIARPAVAASVLAHVLAAALAVSSALAAGTFFPRAAAKPPLAFRGGDWVDEGRGIRILADGAMTGAPIRAAAVRAPIPPFGGFAVGCVLLLWGSALPMWALLLVEDSRARRIGLGYAAATSAGTIVCFHAAAVGALPAILAVIPSGALLAGAAVRYRRQST
jgi:hypothetical protein